MQFKQLIDDNNAVSPVIGVILMVAITVILAAVIGTFVLGLGDQVSNTSPQASFTFDQNQNDGYHGGTNPATLTAIDVTHDGGDSISSDNLDVRIDGNPAVDIEQTGDTGPDTARRPYDSGNDVGAGNTQKIDAYFTGADATNIDGTSLTYDTSNSISESNYVELTGDEEIRVVWTSSNGGDSATLGQYSVE